MTSDRLPDGTASPRRADIQGLRALSVLMVVAFHAHLPVLGGFTGVDVLFVISGFVITSMLAREWYSTGSIDLRRFYLRRSLRLLPALAVMVSGVMLAAVALLSPFGPQQTAARTGIGALLFAANLVVACADGDYFAAAAEENPLLHTWSLSVEEQFDLVFPAAMIGAFTLGRVLRRPTLVPAALLGTASPVSLALAVAWVDGSKFAAALSDPFGGPETFAFYGLPSRIWEFGVGCLLALAVAHGIEKPRALREALGALGLGLVFASAWWLDEAAPFPGRLAFVPVAGAALLLVAG